MTLTVNARSLGSRRVAAAALLLGLPALGGLCVGGAAAGFPVDSDHLTVVSRPESVPATSCTAAATADTHTDQQDRNTNFGTASELRVGARNAQVKRTFITFDLAACAIPSGARVLSASLRLHVATRPTQPRSYDVHRLTGGFVESTLTWNTAQPTSATSVTSSSTIGPTTGATLTWDVRSDVARFVSTQATSHGWLLRDATESGPTLYQAAFSSRDHAVVERRPLLVIDYYS